MEMRAIAAAELEPFLRASEGAFHEDVHDEDLELFSELVEPDRTLAAFDGAQMVATTAIFTRELTVPGAVMSVAGVTLVGVLPTHRRRGLLTQLMRRQLDDVRAAGESVAALWASEAAIYGRFGYGCAARHATATLRIAGARLARDAPRPQGCTSSPTGASGGAIGHSTARARSRPSRTSHIALVAAGPSATSSRSRARPSGPSSQPCLTA